MPIITPQLNLGPTVARLNALGLLAETIPVQVPGTAQAYVSQQLEGQLVGLLGGDVCTGIAIKCEVAAAGADVTHARSALLSSAGVVLALSADLTAAANWTLGTIRLPFSANFTVPATGGYYACYLINGAFGATQPTFVRATGLMASGVTNTASTLPGGVAPSFKQSAVTDLTLAGAQTITTPATFGWYLGVTGTR